ncbi:probable aminotransferase TAT2 isoform X4 [Populus nigra]|uniref:probable aminotransferase TAT2 isoform X4 n=1 Tax=Populus nigra TaxID=3691 RepID=UPI002B273297|nr:probable aminotransferase TAT2 isoform X4 [Populus nigra]
MTFFRHTFLLRCIHSAVADYLSRDLPYRLSPDDVYLTLGCNQAAEITIKVLARPGANILLPRPGYPDVETYAIFNNLEIRQFDLLPERGWEVDLDAVEAISDENTIAMVIINPGNPSGSVYTYNHLNKIAETARKLGILVIADEVYGHLVYGSSPFVPMSLFATIVPVITLGSVSKRWMIPGWGLGWLVTCDPSGLLRKDEIAESINKLLVYSPFPPTLIQGAIPQILEKTTQDFFSKTINILRKNLDICYDKLKEIPCIMIPQKPEGAFFAMVKLNLLLLEDIEDDMEFCLKLAKEESLIILPGVTLGLKNWLRVTFAATIPHILQKTTEDFFSNTIDILREDLDFCFDKLKEIPGLKCPQKAEGGMFIMVKLHLPQLDDIEDDMEFCLKLAKEESLILVPGKQPN